jgi:hypothetical protein
MLCLKISESIFYCALECVIGCDIFYFSKFHLEAHYIEYNPV